MSDTVYPEILVVVDYALYRHLNRDTSAINKYVMSYFNAVNMRFATVSAYQPFPITSCVSDARAVSKAEHSWDCCGVIPKVPPLHHLSHLPDRHAGRALMSPLHGTVLLQDKVGDSLSG